MQERRNVTWPKAINALDEFCSVRLNASHVEGFLQKVTVYRFDKTETGGLLSEVADRCSAREYVAVLHESRSSVPRKKLFESWKQSLQSLGDGEDFFSTAMLACSTKYPKADLTAIYIKNQDSDKLDWGAVEAELDLPDDMRWGQNREPCSDNWLTFHAEKISGITEPWLYIGPGFAGMHQEDGVMNSYNISVPISTLPMTDALLMEHGVDFLHATKVWQFSPSTTMEEDLLSIRKLAGFNTRTPNDQCSWRQLWGRDLIIETDTRWAQSAGHAILTQGQVHSTLSSGGVNLAWNRACGPHWPARARAYDKRIHDAIGKDNTCLTLQVHEVPVTFPTDTIIHQAAMVLVERGRAGVHENIVTGLKETWVPWVREEMELIRQSPSITQELLGREFCGGTGNKFSCAHDARMG